MTDVFTASERSRIMSRIRSHNTKPELFLYRILKKLGLNVRRRTKLPGNPDFFLPEINAAVFVDGCFWHGCRRCKNKVPQTNQKFWNEKIAKNKKRDRKINRILRKNGHVVVRLWEHDLLFKEIF